MKKLGAKLSIVMLFCFGFMCIHSLQNIAEAGAIIANHVVAYSITRHGEEYSIDGPVINIPDKAIAREIKILDEIICDPNASYTFTIWMIHAASNKPVAKMPFEPTPSGRSFQYLVTTFNIFNKPAGDYYIVVEEAREGVLGKFMIRLK